MDDIQKLKKALDQTETIVKKVQEALDAANVRVAGLLAEIADKENKVDEAGKAILAREAELTFLRAKIVQMEDTTVERDRFRLRSGVLEAAMKKLVGIEHRNFRHEGDLATCTDPKCSFVRSSVE